MRGSLASVVMVLATTGCQVALSIYASQAADSADSVSHESAMLVAASDQMTGTMTAEEAATTAAANAGSFFQPEGCYTATTSGATVTYVLNDCTGPFGYVHVTGTVVVTYSAGAGGLGIMASTTNLAVNDATVSFSSTGTLAFDGDTRILTVQSTGQVTGRRGHVFSRSGSYTLRWNPVTECLGLDGSWTTTIDDTGWSTNVSGFEKCGTACPAAGGTISWRGPSVNITVVFDGSSQAEWMSEGRRDRDGTVRLFCGG